jgi:hypothetical protein
LALVLGLLVRTASVFGAIFMLSLLFSSNYPGPRAPFWQYFGASLDHLVLALCFAAFAFSNADAVCSLRPQVQRLRRPAQPSPGAEREYAGAQREGNLDFETPRIEFFKCPSLLDQGYGFLRIPSPVTKSWGNFLLLRNSY